MSIPLRWQPAHGSFHAGHLGSQLGASSPPALAFHAGWIESLGFETRVGNRALGFEHFIGLAVSQVLEVTMRRDERAISIQGAVSVKGSAVRGHTAA